MLAFLLDVPSSEAGVSSSEAQTPSSEADIPSKKAQTPSSEADTSSKKAQTPSSEAQTPSKKAHVSSKKAEWSGGEPQQSPTFDLGSNLYADQCLEARDLSSSIDARSQKPALADALLSNVLYQSCNVMRKTLMALAKQK